MPEVPTIPDESDPENSSAEAVVVITAGPERPTQDCGLLGWACRLSSLDIGVAAELLPPALLYFLSPPEWISEPDKDPPPGSERRTKDTH